MMSGALPFITFATDTLASVHTAPLRSTALVERTVPVTITGDFAINWPSVGITIVVALAAAAAIIRTHVNPYTRNLFMEVSEVIGLNGARASDDSPTWIPRVSIRTQRRHHAAVRHEPR